MNDDTARMPLNSTLTPEDRAATDHSAPPTQYPNARPPHFQFAGSSPRLSENWHFLFTGLVLPTVCVVGVAENALAIYVLAFRLRRGRCGIGATSRAYYVVLAAADIGYLLCYHMSKNFAEYGLRFVTGGHFYFSLAARFLFIPIRDAHGPAARPGGPRAGPGRAWAAEK